MLSVSGFVSTHLQIALTNIELRLSQMRCNNVVLDRIASDYIVTC